MNLNQIQKQAFDDELNSSIRGLQDIPEPLVGGEESTGETPPVGIFQPTYEPSPDIEYNPENIFAALPDQFSYDQTEPLTSDEGY